MLINKLYSNTNRSELIIYYYLVKHHDILKGINIVTFYYTDPQTLRILINYKIITLKDKKTKNKLFGEVLKEILN